MAPMTKKPIMMYKIQPHPDCTPCISNSNIAPIPFRIHPKMLQPTNRKPISKIAPMIYNMVIALIICRFLKSGASPFLFFQFFLHYII